jgi:Calcineurin-like phosphoesterase
MWSMLFTTGLPHAHWIVAVVVTSVFWLVAIAAFLRASIAKEEGVRVFWGYLGFVVFMIAMYETFVLQVGPHDSTVMQDGPAGFWLGYAMSPFVIVCFFAFRVARGLVRRTIHLQETVLPRGCLADFRVAHLSDLHLALERTIEGHLDANLVRQAVCDAVSWALRHSHLVFVTGDVTDSGAAGEWAIFNEILDDLSLVDRERILYIPGNHDLSLTLDWDALSDPNVSLDFEARCRSFVMAMLRRCPDTWSMFFPWGQVSVRHALMRAADYIDIYEQHPPFEETGWIGEYPVPSVGYSPELLEAAERCEGHRVWPRRGAFRYTSFIAFAYPMVMYENADFLVVGLNSCTDSSDSILDSGLGKLGDDQLERLALLLGSAREKCKILLLHHHVGFPPKIHARLRKTHASLQLRALQLRDAKKLRAILRGFKKVIIFHGHKHVGYHAICDSSIVISSPSVAYGDVGGAAPNCSVYGLDREGRVCILEVTTIAAS